MKGSSEGGVVRNEKKVAGYKKRASRAGIIWSLFFFLYALYSLLIPVYAYYGKFYDGADSRDSVWMNISTFDTLGFRSNADSVWFYRFYRTAVIDSTILIGAGTRIGYYLTGKRAFDGTNYGEYNVLVRWKIQGKYFVRNESYTVFPDSVTGIGRIQTNQDKSDYQLASGQVVARADSVTGVGRVSINLDKTNYQLASGQVVARADSVTGVGRISTNLDKADYRLSSQGQADIWVHDTTGENSGWAGFFKGRLDANITSRFAPGDSGITARATWDDDLIAQANRRIRYVDSLGEDVTGSEATSPDTIANHVWSWYTRTLTSGAGSGSNQVTIYTLQSSDSIPVSAVQVQVLNQNQSATEGLLTSDALGQSIFALNGGIYKIRMFKPGWQFTVPESIIVSGNTADTFYSEIFDPGTPLTPELCRVYGWVQDLKGQPLAGATIEAKVSNAPLKFQSVLISPYYKTTNTDSDGYWYLDLYPNSRLSPPNTQYDFTIYIPYGTILRLKTTVPEQLSWELVW